MTDAPFGWTRARLGDLGTWYGGSTPSKSEATYWEAGSIPWLSPKDMRHPVIRGTADHVTPRALAETSLRLLPAGTVTLVVRSGILARTLPIATTAVPVTLNQDMKAVVPREGIVPEWLAHALRAREHDLLQTCRKAGTTVASIDSKRLLAYQLDVPPAAVQLQMVDQLETVLPQFAAHRDDVERIIRKLAAVERWLIDSAMSGARNIAVSASAPDEDWAAELLEAARALGLRGRAGRAGAVEHGQEGLPEGWRWVRWEQVGLSQNGTAVPSSDYGLAGLRLLRPGNLDPSGWVTWSDQNTRRLPAAYSTTHARFLVGPGSLVMNLTAQSLADEFLGRVCMTRSDDEPCLLNQRIARLVPIGCHARFAYYVFKTTNFRRLVDSLNTGSLIQHMHTKQIADYWFGLPSPTAQVAIVERLDAELAAVASLRAQLHKQKQRLQATQAAVLRATTSGWLPDVTPGPSVDSPSPSTFEPVMTPRAIGGDAA